MITAERTDQQGRTIAATIDQAALARVPSFFNATIEHMVRELLQNSRRAGATLIRVTHQGGRATFSDDGRGVEDPQSLLNFGGSGWTDDAVLREHPAGMGVYSLARTRGLNIASRQAGQPGWSVSLEPDHFAGNGAATVEALPQGAVEGEHGTTVGFTQGEDFAKQLARAARYMSIPVFMNGEPVEQEDFLADAMTTSEWEGLTIGVVRGRGRRHARGGYINFHGVTVQAPDIAVGVSTINQRLRYDAAVEVDYCDRMELTLPARTDLVRNDFSAELREQCLIAIYRVIANDRDANGISRERQLEASRLGVPIAEPPPNIRRWRPWSESRSIGDSKTEDPMPVSEDTIIYSVTENTAVEHTLDHALEFQGMTGMLAEPDSNLVGYGWYDVLEHVVDARVTAAWGDHEMVVGEGEDEPPDQRPDRINVTLRVRAADGSERDLTLDTDLSMTNEVCDYIEDLRPLVTATSTMTCVELGALLLDAYFRHSDDYDSDSYDTQRTRAETDTDRLCENLLGDPETVLKERLRCALRDGGAMQLPAGSIIKVTIEEEHQMDISIEPAPAG